MLVLLAVSHRLFASIWNGRSMCFTGSLPLSNYCVCSLALDFIIIRCVSPCPWNFNVGRCINDRSFRLSADRRVRFFAFVSFFLLQALHGIKPSRVTSKVANSQLLITNQKKQEKNPTTARATPIPPARIGVPRENEPQPEQ